MQDTQAQNALQSIAAIKLYGRTGEVIRPKINSHIHLPPNFSAFENLSQIIQLAQEQQIKVLGFSNYYDFAIYDEFLIKSKESGIFGIFGLEIIAFDNQLADQGVKLNDPGNPGKLYICGKGITRFRSLSARAKAIIQKIRNIDSERIRNVINKVNKYLADQGINITMTENLIIEGIVKRHGVKAETVYLQERHICQAYQNALFEYNAGNQNWKTIYTDIFPGQINFNVDDAVVVQNELRNNLLKKGKPGYVAEEFIDFREAFDLILQLGGIPCYPILLDGASPLSPYEETPGKLIENLRANNIHAAEVIPLRNNLELLSVYVKALRQAGIIVTAGTEHNSLTMAPLEPVCKNGVKISAELQEIFWEGAAVIAAHQYLNLNDQDGYVDGIGRLNIKHLDQEERIYALASMGKEIISRYCNLN